MSIEVLIQFQQELEELDFRDYFHERENFKEGIINKFDFTPNAGFKNVVHQS